MLGAMAMPQGFKYRSVFLRGKPRHQKYDDFWRKHPPMPAAHWAKIFAPFDALSGFSEELVSSESHAAGCLEIETIPYEDDENYVQQILRGTQSGTPADH